MKKVKCFFKIFFCFSRETNDHINTDSTMRHQCFDQLHPFCIQFSFIPASHQSQNLIAAALQWNMKMRHELIAVGNKFNDLISKQVGFNRRNAVTFNSFYFIQVPVSMRKEIFFSSFGAFSKSPRLGAGVGRNHPDLLLSIQFLLLPCAAKFFHIFHYICNTITPAFSSCHRDGTERTIIIAAILYF